MTTASNSVETSFREFAAEVRSIVDFELDRILPASSTPPVSVHSAIRWSVFAGGKRFRPLLLIATGKAFGADIDELVTTACAFELIHTYSLIHDDLPSMDDDDLRRGKPTCHVKFGEATAILAGDALQTLAFQLIATAADLPSETRVRLMTELARASGTPAGMVAGQAHDLEAETRNVSSEELEQIHRLKTGALINAAARCGAIIGDVSAQDLNSITQYASQLGLLFQITDDLLDLSATAETLGKTPGKDVRSQKATYPSVFGVESARERAVRIHADACEILSKMDRPTDHLREIADFILDRTA
jgi:geranylgeranyl diphosphate synthase, type II